MPLAHLEIVLDRDARGLFVFVSLWIAIDLVAVGDCYHVVPRPEMACMRASMN